MQRDGMSSVGSHTSSTLRPIFPVFEFRYIVHPVASSYPWTRMSWGSTIPVAVDTQ